MGVVRGAGRGCGQVADVAAATATADAIPGENLAGAAANRRAGRLGRCDAGTAGDTVAGGVMKGMDNVHGQCTWTMWVGESSGFHELLMDVPKGVYGGFACSEGKEKGT